MLYKSNILALVGGGINPKFSPNKVIIWDELNGKIISQLRFDTNVKNIKLTKVKVRRTSTFEVGASLVLCSCPWKHCET